MHLLLHGELCVCDIIDVLKLPQSKVSRHLGYLRRAGLVSDRKKGLWRYYSVAPTTLRLQNHILDGLKNYSEEIDGLKKELKNINTMKRNCS
jgi:ArsR family transcriptional regulator